MGNKVVGEEPIPYNYEYTSESTFGDFLKTLSYDDYMIWGVMTINFKYIKFIIRKENNKVLWNKPFEEIKICDYVNTYSELPMVYLNPSALGAAGSKYMEIWNQFLEVLPIVLKYAEDAITIIGCIDGVKRFYKFIMKTEKESEIPFTINTFDSFVFSRDKWNAIEFAEYLDIDKDSAIMQLKARGYEYDKHYQLYVLNKDKQLKYDKMIKHITANENPFEE